MVGATGSGEGQLRQPACCLCPPGSGERKRAAKLARAGPPLAATGPGPCLTTLSGARPTRSALGWCTLTSWCARAAAAPASTLAPRARMCAFWRGGVGGYCCCDRKAPHGHSALPHPVPTLPAPIAQNNLTRTPKASAWWMAKHFYAPSKRFPSDYYHGLYKAA